MNNNMIYNKDNIILNYENKYINVKYKDVLNLFEDKYISGIKENNLSNTLIYKDYENINKVVEMSNCKGNAFDFTKSIALNASDKFNNFMNMLESIYNYYNDIKIYNLKYDEYLKSVIDLSSNNLDELKQFIAKLLNELNELDEQINEYLSDINDKYNKVSVSDDFVGNIINDNSLFELDINSVKQYSEFISTILINLDEFKTSSKSLEDYFVGINIKTIIIDSIEILVNNITGLNSFIIDYLKQQSNNEDNVVYYLETNSVGLLNNIAKQI